MFNAAAPAPAHQAPYDNLDTIRRVLVSWYTSDGLSWQQRWWGQQPSAELAHELVPQHYGADNFCATADRNANDACIGEMDEPGAALLTAVFPYDAGKQTFGMDFMFSRQGSAFRVVDSEQLPASANATPVPAKVRPQFAQPGHFGESWNGGFMCGIRSGFRHVGRHSYAVMPMVQNGAHFISSWRSSSANPGWNNFTVDAYVKWAKTQFFGPTLEEWPYFKTLGGWPGVAKLANDLRIEVGVLRWRYQGWVALAAGAGGGTVVTRPVVAPEQAVVTANLNATSASLGDDDAAAGCALVHLDVPRRQPGSAVGWEPLGGFSGSDAAKICSDAVNATLVWGTPATTTRHHLPLTPGNVFSFRIELGPSARPPAHASRSPGSSRFPGACPSVSHAGLGGAHALGGYLALGAHSACGALYTYSVTPRFVI